MTLPRAESDLLMLPASFNRSPPAFVELYVAWHSEQGNWCQLHTQLFVHDALDGHRNVGEERGRALQERGWLTCRSDPAKSIMLSLDSLMLVMSPVDSRDVITTVKTA
jgi:hypothetical protein